MLAFLKKMEFTPYKPEQPPQGKALQEIEEDKRKTCRKPD